MERGPLWINSRIGFQLFIRNILGVPRRRQRHEENGRAKWNTASAIGFRVLGAARSTPQIQCGHTHFFPARSADAVNIAAPSSSTATIKFHYFIQFGQNAREPDHFTNPIAGANTRTMRSHRPNQPPQQ